MTKTNLLGGYVSLGGEVLQSPSAMPSKPMTKLLVLRNGAKVTTPHGVGTVANFEVYPPLYAKEHGTRQQWAGPDILDEFPDDPVDGSFIRIGVKGCHPTLDIAYYTVNELEP